jgi:hypothetical protein
MGQAVNRPAPTSPRAPNAFALPISRNGVSHRCPIWSNIPAIWWFRDTHLQGRFASEAQEGTGSACADFFYIEQHGKGSRAHYQHNYQTW